MAAATDAAIVTAALVEASIEDDDSPVEGTVASADAEGEAEG